MSIHFTTENAQALLNDFDAHIHQAAAAGKITTWKKSADGNYYTHVAKDWTSKAWLKPVIATGQLIFNIIKPQNANITIPVYAYYHGHLIETFLNHFDSKFQNGFGTALPHTGDMVK